MWFFASADSPPSGPPAEKPTTDAQIGTSTATADPAADIAQLSAGNVKIREHLSATAKTLGTAGTALVGAVGYTQMNDVFPVPPGFWGVVLGGVAITGFLAAAAGVVLVAQIFSKAQRRILLTTRLDEDSPEGEFNLSKTEATIVIGVMDVNAHEDEARSLRALELRALRFKRIARTVEKPNMPEEDGARVTRFRTECDRLDGAVTIGLKRASATLLERRATDAVGGAPTRGLLLMVAVGVISLWAAAALSAGQRELIALNKDCGAVGAQSKKDLCATVRPAPPGSTGSTGATDGGSTSATGATPAVYPPGISGPLETWRADNPDLAGELARIVGCTDYLSASGARRDRNALTTCVKLSEIARGPTGGGK